jgi:beta-glucosidase
MSGHAIAEVLTGAFAPRGRLPVALIDNSREGLPLGHGLGFSPFRIEEPRIELGHNRIVVTSILHNVGEREGMETVQLYLRRPINQLGHFETNGKFTVEPGAYEISVGLSERRAFSEQISVPRAVVEAMSRDLASEPLPALFGKLRSVG